MRLLIAAALLAVVIPAAAFPQAQAKPTAIRFAMALPHDGNAASSLSKLPLQRKGKTVPKLKVVVRAEKPLPGNVVATYRAVVKGSTLYVGPTFVVPHVLDKSGTITKGTFGFDTTVFANYGPGLVGADSSHGVALDVFLFDNDRPVALGGPACSACTFGLGTGRKQLLRVDDLLTPHSPPSACKLGFGVIVVNGATDDANIQGFVVNSHTGAFDLSVFGFDPTPISAAVESGAADAACGVPSAAAKTLTDFARPAAKGFTLTVDATHHHGASRSNLCVRARTSPPQTGNASIALAGPSGAGAQTVALGPDGSATAVFGITQFGAYTGSAAVGATSGTVSCTVDGGAGQAFSCPGP